eukprot:COSAG06_NODE_71_length_25945_cov_9.124468_31_plen_166_part_00
MELQGMKTSERRSVAAAASIDVDSDWGDLSKGEKIDSILAAEFRAGGAQAYVTRAAYGVEGRDPQAPLKAAALVIGIQNYEGARKLRNTLSDAKAVAAKFEGMGFTVLLLTDETAEGGKVTQKLMQRHIKDFIKQVDENTITAFAFMGESVLVAALAPFRFLVFL